jgi:hypothetical protein
MKKNYFHLFLLSSAIVFALLLSGCAQKATDENEDAENDLYDGPAQAAAFQYKRTKDPATGQVPSDKMWAAIVQTNNLKNAVAAKVNTPSGTKSALAPLSWTERGSFSDAAGPSGNSRPGNNPVTSGRIRAVWVDLADATGKTIWVGGVDGGIWKTSDITAAVPTWSLVNDQLSNLAVTGICQDPVNTNNMYFCTGEAFFNGDAVRGVGVFKSTDHGASWNLLSSTTTLIQCTKILCDKLGNVYLSTLGIGVAVGLQRSTDGGTSWTSINPFSTTSRIVDFEISTTGAMHVSAGFFSAPGVGGYKYTANPATCTATSGWNSPTTAFPFPELATPNPGTRTELACNGNTIYAALANPNSANTSTKIDAIAKSVDGGDNWTTVQLTTTNISDLNGGTGQGWYSIGMEVDPSDPNTVIVGSLNLLKSTDGGASFTKISEWVGNTGQYVHADMHNVAWYNNGNKLLIGCDGGLFYSTNKGTTFSDKNTGLRIKQFYSVAIHPTSTNYFLCGAQDNGTHQFNGAGLTSSIEVLGGDGGFTAIDQDEPLFQAGAYVFTNFRRSANGGTSWFSSGSSSTDGQFINPFDYDNLNNRVYAGTIDGNYLRWEDPHTGFTFNNVPITAFGTGGVSAVKVSPFTANRVYFGADIGKVIRVDDANAAAPTGVDITPAGMGTVYVNSINTGSNEQSLIVTLTNYGVTNIWVSTNGGTSWTGCDGNLPNMPVYTALFHPDGDSKAYISTETGVWSTELLNGVNTVWLPETAFPNVRTDMLRYRASDRLLAAATHGRGLWTATIPVGCVSAVITNQPVNTTTCAASPATFTVGASGISYQWQESINGGGAWSNITNGGIYSGAATTSLTLSSVNASQNSYQYRCIVTGNGSCAPASATSTAAILSVNEVPGLFTLTGGGTFCAGNTGIPVGLSGSAVGINYQLKLNGVNSGTPVAGTGAALSFGIKTDGGTYTVTAITNTAGACTRNMTGNATVVVNQQPTLNFGVSPYTNLFPGLTTTLTAAATSSATPNTLTYLWTKDNINITNTGSTLSINNTAIGAYKVKITDANGCINQSQVIIVGDSASDKLFVYPNPNNGKFNVTRYYKGTSAIKQIVTVYNSKGQLVYKSEFVIALPYQVLNIDLRKEAAGVYYVVLSDVAGKKIKTVKVLVR